MTLGRFTFFLSPLGVGRGEGRYRLHAKRHCRHRFRIQEDAEEHKWGRDRGAFPGAVFHPGSVLDSPGARKRPQRPKSRKDLPGSSVDQNRSTKNRRGGRKNSPSWPGPGCLHAPGPPAQGEAWLGPALVSLASPAGGRSLQRFV